MVRLDFHVPPMGYVSVTLYDESEKIYDWLDRNQEIDRLKRLDHLGAIRLAWEGAHHPRWEYIVCVLYLIDHCKNRVPEAHLGSEVKLESSITISSGSELLKCWTLLLNVGHLVWTFFAERALLLELWKNRNRRKEFLSLFSSNIALQKWVENILSSGDFYRFYQALAFIRLESIAAQAPSELAWKEILVAYVLEQEDRSAVARLRDIYRKLRRVAYLTLDPHYTPTGFKVHSMQLLTNASLLSRVLMAGSSEEKVFTAFERLLYENIYLGEEAVRAMAARDLVLRGEIRERLRRNGLFETINLLANGELQRDIHCEDLHTVVRLPIWVEPPFHDLIVKFPNPRILQDKLSKLPRELRRRACVIVWPSADGSSWVVQAHAQNGDAAAQAEVYRQIFKYVVKLRQEAEQWEELLDEETIQELLFGRLACELVERALQLCSHSRQDLRWEWRRMPGSPAAIITTRDNAGRLVRKILPKDPGNPRRAELHGILTVLEQLEPGVWIALSIGRMEAYHGKEKLCELDGCLVEERGREGKIVVTLIEAKSGKKGAVSEAREQLSMTLRKLGCRCGVELKNVKREGCAVAWASIEIGVHSTSTLAEGGNQR